MQPDELLDTLVETGVLEPTAGGESVAVTAEFQEFVEETETTLERRERLREELDARFDDPEVVDRLVALGDEDLRFVAQCCGLAERAGLPVDDLVRTVAVLAQLQGDPPRAEGVPDPFLPVRGEQLPTLLELTRRAVVYVWQEDCEPCDVVRETFEEILDGPPEDIALFAVYGPDWAELLYEEFDVAGAPTTLFVLGGEVDSRLNGPHYSESYEGELETLRELA